ncbi:glycosyltransferase [Hallerella sp.]|uniref:glycosyltransferase n=1 Tax=Hallerella TaxID=2815788 RepID=UPI00338F57CE
MTLTNYKVSILIPVYNVSSFIIRCLKSVSAQTYDGELECILVDDCGCKQVIKTIVKL